MRRTLVVAVVVLFASCSSKAGPVVVVGVDGLEWSVALPLIREGRLPTLEALMQRGSFGTLSTRAPAKSPVIWTTVVTGKEPTGHGIVDFTRPDEDGGRRLFMSGDRKTKALWNILDDAGQRSIVVGWWTTFPVEPITGVMVSQANTLERVNRRGLLKPGGVEPGIAGQVHPEAREEEIFAIVDQVDKEAPWLVASLYPELRPGVSSSDALRWEACLWSLRADESVRRIALRLVRTSPFPEVLLVYFGTTDTVGHLFWRYHQPEAFRYPPSAERIASLGSIVNRTYEHVDAVLGELLAVMPRDTTVFVVSDHGMEAKHVHVDYDAEAQDEPERGSGGHGSGPPGVIVVAGPAVRRGDLNRPIRELTRADLPWIGDVVDITPTILALREVPIGQDMDGAVLENILKPGVLDALDPTFVASHDTPEWRSPRGGGEVTRPGEKERLEQLRALGYLDEHGEAVQ